MQVKTDSYDVGVIVGRFQVPELHDAHADLIKTVCDNHDKVIIFLGLSPLMVTRENPLDFESRKKMILERFPNVNVLYVKDVNSDELWSKRLDEMIGDLVTPAQSVVLYGGRDSFIAHYEGKYSTQELVQDTYISGKEIRRAVSRKSVKSSPDFRAGVVWAAFSKFPTVYTTVDVAIFDNLRCERLLLGRKENEKEYRFIGGFADPRSESFEQDARREVMEETGIEIDRPRYLDSFKIDDWRYRGEVDCIKTMLFSATLTFGSPRPDDDIVELRWFDYDTLSEADVVHSHRVLLRRLHDTFPITR